MAEIVAPVIKIKVKPILNVGIYIYHVLLGFLVPLMGLFTVLFKRPAGSVVAKVNLVFAISLIILMISTFVITSKANSNN